MIVESWLERAAALRPGTVAVEAPDGALSYAALAGAARAGAAELAARGVRRGDRVALLLPAGLPFAVALHACGLLGAVAMPVDLRLAPGERDAQLAQAGAVVDAPLAGQVSAPSAALTAHAPAADEALVVVHTSGTTGAPRPVALSWGNVLASALASAAALGLDRRERWLCPLPLAHVGGLMVLLRAAVFATTAVLGPADRDDVTVASLVPTQLGRLLAAGAAPPPRLRVVLLGGAAADPALLRRARDAGWPVSPSYGLTQTCSAVCIAEPGDVETSGRPVPGTRVAVAGDGEILVEGPSVAGGGLLRTGDLGRLDERGRLMVVGRKADTIVTGGENVAPTEVEAALLAHPDVAEAGVYGRPDPEWGEAITARVVLVPGAQAGEAELRAWAAERLARYKVPKRVELAGALPRTASGKLLRRELGGGGDSP